MRIKMGCGQFLTYLLQNEWSGWIKWKIVELVLESIERNILNGPSRPWSNFSYFAHRFSGVFLLKIKAKTETQVEAKAKISATSQLGSFWSNEKFVV